MSSIYWVIVIGLLLVLIVALVRSARKPPVIIDTEVQTENESLASALEHQNRHRLRKEVWLLTTIFVLLSIVIFIGWF